VITAKTSKGFQILPVSPEAVVAQIQLFLTVRFKLANFQLVHRVDTF
jgi:hypothetical protein